MVVRSSYLHLPDRICPYTLLQETVVVVPRGLHGALGAAAARPAEGMLVSRSVVVRYARTHCYRKRVGQFLCNATEDRNGGKQFGEDDKGSARDEGGGAVRIKSPYMEPPE
ncbi:uncharacterized protein EMH_0069480 [Eimeria mitis]|uniref:Uncharacterized protein n=1 Tax=Eimeria mitis TaxID=44415 RepID=U6KHC3_9EIME|nr:uncharacterized protein EMH_0069480 [Eimeria mitis]CDJ36201.1 hypothetical protein EMH_0069480 [Eimeria mitis]